MHRKAVFALAGVFLAVAIVVPPLIFILQADQDLDNLIVVQNPTGLQTNGNVTITDETSESHTNNIILVGVIDGVFIPLFAVTLYFAVNHPHPIEEDEAAEDDNAPKT